MKRFFQLLLLAIFVSSCGGGDPQPQLQDGATTMDFNWGWRFTLGAMEDDFYQPKSDDSKWQSVKVPHDWSIESGYTQEHTAGSNAFLPGGVGWYRKSFNVPSQWKGKDIIVRFEGVYNNSTVWINGEELGFYPNGYLDFDYDLTPYLKGGENVIAVRVDRRAYADARWYVGGGIYRNVHLSAREKVYIPETGISVVTPKVSAQSAEVEVATEVVNGSVQDVDLVVKYSINGCCESKVLSEGEAKISLKAAAEGVVSTTIPLATPKLWSLESPRVYKLYTALYNGDQLLEERETQFGVRTIEFNASKGFLLNGESVKIKGVNIHHDLGCVGVAAYDAALYRRLNSLRAMGTNAIRVAHNPQSESFYTMCDTMGLLVMDEFIDEWRVLKDKWIIQRSKSGVADSLQMGYSAHFNEWAEKDIKHLVKRNRNHPSIILWSIGNEIEWTYPYYFRSAMRGGGYKGLIYTGAPSDQARVMEDFKKYSGGKDELSETAHELSSWVKSVDTSRPVTSGVVIPSVSRLSGYTDALDVVGYNYKDMFYEADHRIYPDKCIIGSENVGQYYEWSAVMDRDYIPGIFVWTGVDYMGENGPWPAKGGTYSFFDFACFKTPRGHFFETLWRDEPKTYLVTTPSEQSEFKVDDKGQFSVQWIKDPLRRWQWYENVAEKWKYTQGEKVMVQVYTNAPTAELFINDKSLGIKSRAKDALENVLLWEVPYEAGKLLAVGRDEKGDRLSCSSLVTSGDVASVKIESDKLSINSDGYDLANVEITLLDKDGVKVVDQDQEIVVKLGGDVKIVGIDNGSDKFVGDHQADRITTYNGRALVVLQSQYGASGVASVEISTASGVKGSFALEYNAK